MSNQTEQPVDVSKRDKVKLKSISGSTGHGFTVHKSLQDLHEFFTTDHSEDVRHSLFEPPLFKTGKPTRKDLAKSRGVLS